LRVLPILRNVLPKDIDSEETRKALKEILLPLFRCAALPVTAIFDPRLKFLRQRYASAAANFADATLNAVAFVDASSADAAFALATVADTIMGADFFGLKASSASSAAFASSAASVGYGTNSYNPAIHAIAETFVADLTALRPIKGRILGRRVINMPLWPHVGVGIGDWQFGMSFGQTRSTEPNEFRHLWIEFKNGLFEAGDDWDVWVEWYDGVIFGAKNDGTYLFGLPTEHALRLWRDIAGIDDAIWKAGPAVLNAEFKRLVAEARAEVALDASPRTTERPTDNSKVKQSNDPEFQFNSRSTPNDLPQRRPKQVKSKTKIGEAIIAHAIVLGLQTNLIIDLIDKEITRLEEMLHNYPDDIAARDAEIAILERLKTNALSLSEAISAYPIGGIAEKEAVKRTNAFLKPFGDMWTEHGSSIVHLTCVNGLFIGAISIAHMIGVPINGFMATTAISAITAGKPLTEVLRAYKGGAHSAKPDGTHPKSS
jgi:hypothetical protein